MRIDIDFIQDQHSVNQVSFVHARFIKSKVSDDVIPHLIAAYPVGQRHDQMVFQSFHPIALFVGDEPIPILEDLGAIVQVLERQVLHKGLANDGKPI